MVLAFWDQSIENFFFLLSDSRRLLQRSLVTATKTRKKQQTDMIKLALLQRENQERNERETFLITTIPILTQAANEQRSHHNAGDDHDEGIYLNTVCLKYYTHFFSPVSLKLP